MTIHLPDGLKAEQAASRHHKRIKNSTYTGGPGSRGGQAWATAATLPFVAWDGEGYTDEQGVHHYYLFGCSDGDYVVNPDGLSHIECFELMLKVAQRRRAIHVIFAGSYDVTMMIHKYPTDVATRITRGQAKWWDGYRHEWFKGKYLKLGDGTRNIVLYDVFTFFQTSFVKALQEYLGDNEEFDRIADVKLQRDTFTLDSLETLVMPYWRQELRYLVELCNKLREHFIEADIPVRQWHGPGAVASAVLRSRGIKAHMAKPNEAVLEASRHAYYGGRFEQFKVGQYIGPVHQYDIRSAYPFAITHLPSLTGRTWRHGQLRRNRIDPYGLYRVSWSTRDDVPFTHPNPLPWRAHNRAIFYPPTIIESWYWGVEIQDLVNSKVGTLTIHEAWEMEGTHTNYPFTFIGDMYTERARMKAEGDPTQLALKLAMNSIYGKLAQSKGSRLRGGVWQLPAYHQLEWAGWITAFTRAMIRRAIDDIGYRNLVAIETDAVYTLTPVPTQGFTHIQIGDQLGQWDHDPPDGIMYLQSGVYFKLYGNQWKLKSRGFEPKGHTQATWEAVLQHLPASPDKTVTTHVRRFGAVPGTSNYARWYSQDRHSRIITTESKRIHVPTLCAACKRGQTFADALHDLVVPEMLEPCSNASSMSSTPHHLPWVDDGIPEWFDDWMITEDGYFDLQTGEE